MTASKYRKKPVEIMAAQFTVESAEDVLAWANGSGARMELKLWPDYLCRDGERRPGWANISTLEGTMTVAIGDWVIKGVKGEFYPCKPDIFEATYEAVGRDEP